MLGLFAATSTRPGSIWTPFRPTAPGLPPSVRYCKSAHSPKTVSTISIVSRLFEKSCCWMSAHACARASTRTHYHHNYRRRRHVTNPPIYTVPRPVEGFCNNADPGTGHEVRARCPWSCKICERDPMEGFSTDQAYKVEVDTVVVSSAARCPSRSRPQTRPSLRPCNSASGASTF